MQSVSISPETFVSLALSSIGENASDDLMWSWVLKKHLLAALPAFLDTQPRGDLFDLTGFSEFLKMGNLISYVWDTPEGENREKVVTLLSKAPGYDPELGLDQPQTTRDHLEYLRLFAVRLLSSACG